MDNTLNIDHNNKVLRVSAATMRELDKHWADSKKIQAIKVLRNATKCGLKEAKQAVEKRYDSKSYSNPDAYDIMPLMLIKAITVDIGAGEVTMTLDEFHMMSLMKLEKIGIDECRRLIDLHDKLMLWQGLAPSGEPLVESDD
jgi:hypothetical protein